MSTGLIGRKLGMTRVFTEDGAAVPVTVIQAGPCPVVQVRDGAVQLGFGSRKASRATKATVGHAKKAGLEADYWSSDVQVQRFTVQECHGDVAVLLGGENPADAVPGDA